MSLPGYLRALQALPGVTEADARRMAAKLERQFRATERAPTPPPASTGKTIDVEV